MSSYLSDPGAPGTKPPARPPIWSGERRRRAPDLRQFARDTLDETRSWGGPLVDRLAGHLDVLANRAAEGRGKALALRLGRVGRMLPSADRVSGVLAGTSRLVSQSALTVAGPPPLEGLPLRPWGGAPGAVSPPPAPPVPAAVEETLPVIMVEPAPVPTKPAVDGDQATLELIRTVIRAPVQPSHPVRSPLPPPRPRGRGALPDLEPPVPQPPGLALRASGRALGWVFITLLAPVAALRVGVAALRDRGTAGQDD